MLLGLMTTPPKGHAIKIGGASLYKTGTSRFDLRDPYHIALTASWPSFFLAIIGTFVLINLVFAALYLVDPGAIANARPYSLRDAFFFSMETLATVGYGSMAPSSTYGHVVSALELICGLTFSAIMTGLIFVRFSKVKPNMLFADKLVICAHEGRPTLMVRLAYGRPGMLVATNARLHIIKAAKTSEGRTFRNALEAKLVRSHLPLLVLTWTLMHPIDEDSPLFGMSEEEVKAADLRTIVTFEGRDHSLASSIFDLKSYSSAEILFRTVYQDLVTTDADRRTSADVRNISLTQPE